MGKQYDDSSISKAIHEWGARVGNPNARELRDWLVENM
jgi:hypothetical protein